MENLAPIVLFVYNRPEHTKRTIESLKRNHLASDSKLFVFSDGPKNESAENSVLEVREIIKKLDGFKSIEIVEREKNLGLANSVISGVTHVIGEFGRVIVLEDDVLASPSFLEFMNSSLEYFKEEKSIFSLSGFSHPINIPFDYKKDIFISRRASSWGWGTWENSWNQCDWSIRRFQEFKRDKNMQTHFNIFGEDLTPMLFAQNEGAINSWAIRWTFHHFVNKGFCVYPTQSFVENIGTDSSGTHFNSTNKFDVNLSENNNIKLTKELSINDEILSNINNLVKPSILRKLINFLKYLV